MTRGLTVAMIVRDERENLEALLPILTAGADDVVVVDTGSTDGTADVARALGARVFETRWTNDFASARNRGLDEVRTSHTLWLDADDRLEVADLERIREEALERGSVGIMLIVASTEFVCGDRARPKVDEVYSMRESVNHWNIPAPNTPKECTGNKTRPG
jgi:glycosyltransferase involved in cell wall biosynthesis